jgi:curli biogenesis system outer membrane secretion channel CsgG
MKNFILIFLSVVFLISCAVPQMERRESVEAPATPEVQKKAQIEIRIPIVKTYKRKIAIGRFTNETNYGLGLLRDNDLDPLGKQASDILSADLVRSERFIVLERPDLGKLANEQQITHRADLVGVDTLIIGSVSEFGRTTEGTSGFLSSTKKQRVHAKINIRLVDPETGHLFFSTTGAGEAVTESGEVAGFGSNTDYDATLNDKAIRAAIANAMDSLITNLGNRPWKTNILSIEGKNVLIGGGSLQGLKIGDHLMVMEEGKKVRNPQSGFMMTLPGKEIARLKIESFFGNTETDQGSICSLISGTLGGISIEKAVVSEIPETK